MTTSIATTSRPALTPEGYGHTRRIARIAGASYLLMFILAIVGNFVAVESLVVDGDAAATTANIAESPSLLQVGIAAFAAIVLLDVFLSWALYAVFRSVDRRLAQVMGWFRLVYSVVLGVGVAFLVQALNVATDATSEVVRAEETMRAVETFQTTWLLGLVLFGLHLVLLGTLVVRSGFAPKVLGFLLAFAGVAYAVDTAARFMLPDYDAVAGIFLVLVALPSMVGEGWLGIWLLGSRRIPA
jgi:hypothetical protein